MSMHEEVDDYEESVTWISLFLGDEHNALLCHVDEDFILDQFNLTGLNREVENFSLALDMINDVQPEEELDEQLSDDVQSDAEILYGLVHRRFVLTGRGLAAMADKFRRQGFGTCPRVLCQKQAVLPVGLTEDVGKIGVKLFCPRCEEAYEPPSIYKTLDGAYFGTTFPHLFFMVYPELHPRASRLSQAAEEDTTENTQPSQGGARGGRDCSFVPLVFGFKLHHTWFDKSLEARREQKARKLARQRSSDVRLKSAAAAASHRARHQK